MGIIFEVIVSTHYCKFQNMEKIYKYQCLILYDQCTFAYGKTVFKNLAIHGLLFLNKLFSSLLTSVHFNKDWLSNSSKTNEAISGILLISSSILKGLLKTDPLIVN